MRPLGPADDTRPLAPPERRPTGFASQPAEHAELALNLNDLLCPSPVTAFFFRADGEPPQRPPIYQDDLLILDTSLRLYDGALVVCVDSVGPGFAVCRVELRDEQVILHADDPAIPPRIIADPTEIYGVIDYVVHRVPRTAPPPPSAP